MADALAHAHAGLLPPGQGIHHLGQYRSGGVAELATIGLFKCNFLISDIKDLYESKIGVTYK